MNEEKQVVGAICFSQKTGQKELSFEDLLMGEYLVQGEIWILKEALNRVGGINYRLKAKQDYELLLRVGRAYKILLASTESSSNFKLTDNVENWICLRPEMFPNNDNDNIDECLKTDCYIIGRYKKELLAMNRFDEAVLKIIYTERETVIHYLEQMITETDTFYKIYDCTQPILIYIGSNLCYGVLNEFSLGLGHALNNLWQHIEYYDISKHPIEDFANFTNQRFKAVIGMQTYMFSVKLKNGGFAHDRITAPKYHFVFDHPIWLKPHLQNALNNFHVLTLDGNYARFIEKYYKHSAMFLPPAGDAEVLYESSDRDFDVSFFGSYGKGILENMQDMVAGDKKKAYFRNRYLLYMRKNLDESPEYAFEKTLNYYGISYSKEEFVEKFYEERWMIFWLANYYRNKVVKTLLDSGIKVHVFGESWKRSPMWMHPLLIYHDAVIGKDSLKVYARSKLSLNVMMWHKDGFTERIANAMLQKSVVVTDKSAYLEKNFINEKELLMFDLKHLEELPKMIKKLLNNNSFRKEIAENGYKKALKYHTWHQRAENLLKLIENDH